MDVYPSNYDASYQILEAQLRARIRAAYERARPLTPVVKSHGVRVLTSAGTDFNPPVVIFKPVEEQK